MRGRLGFQLALTNEGADARGCPEEARKHHAPAQARKGAKPEISMESLIAKYHLHPIIDHFTIALLATGVLADVVGYVIATLFGNRSPRTKRFGDRLSGAALVLLLPGAISADFYHGTPDTERQRAWCSP